MAGFFLAREHTDTHYHQVKLDRVIVIVIDGCGVGALPDADSYNDAGAATIPNLASAVGGLSLPTSQQLGLGNIASIEGVPAIESPTGCFGKMKERAAGKDSTSGHWEISGLVLDYPFPVFPDGFPSEIVERFEQTVGMKTIGNVAASGTQIIERLGKEHLETEKLILYTSADSVFQLAAHESVCSVQRLYQICQSAREILKDKYAVGRVIARPFVGEPGSFSRTVMRRDFSLEPTSDTILDLMTNRGKSVLAVGKIYDLFARRGISEHVKTTCNDEVMDAVTQAVMKDTKHSLIFANCVDFDMEWGHRNNEAWFARGLVEFDQRLGELLPVLRDSDLLIITADHGCDPTIKTSTDHTREYVPLLTYGPGTSHGVNLGTRETFADVACTIAEVFQLNHAFGGVSFLSEITSGDNWNA